MVSGRVIFCTDVHLCHLKYFGWEPEARMERLVEQLNRFRAEHPYERVVFLGDYSLDFWAWQVKGSWLEQGVSNTERFIRRYVSRLEAPCSLLPGNHEQYGHDAWRRLTGGPRQFSVTAGGYLLLCCDNYAGLLDPTEHSDGVYTPTDLDFVRRELAAHPGLPAILCAHFFDLGREPDGFYDFLRQEKRICLLVAGHDHIADVTDLGERAGHVCLYHAGHYSSNTGKLRPRAEVVWGFCDAVLTGEGVEARYLEPAFDGVLLGEPFHHEDREQLHRFFPRRDL